MAVSRVKSGPTEADLLRVTRLSLPIRLFALAAALVLPATAFAGADDDGPKAATMSVTAVTQGSAQLSGTITLGKKDAQLRVPVLDDVLQRRFTATETATHAGDDSHHRKSVSRALTGLAIGTTYHVRLLAWYEDYVASPSTTFTTTGTPAAPEPGARPHPALRPPAPPRRQRPPNSVRRSRSRATTGVIRVNTPGARGFVALDDLTALPVGTVVNASRGTVELQSALPDGTPRRERSTAAASRSARAPRATGASTCICAAGTWTVAAPGRQCRPGVTAAAKTQAPPLGLGQRRALPHPRPRQRCDRSRDAAGKSPTTAPAR